MVIFAKHQHFPYFVLILFYLTVVRLLRSPGLTVVIPKNALPALRKIKSEDRTTECGQSRNPEVAASCVMLTSSEAQWPSVEARQAQYDLLLYTIPTFCKERFRYRLSHRLYLPHRVWWLKKYTRGSWGNWKIKTYSFQLVHSWLFLRSIWLHVLSTIPCHCFCEMSEIINSLRL